MMVEKPYFPPKRPLPPDAAELCTIPPDFLAANPQPLELDLGCARGHFLLAVAAANPGTRFLGVDFQLSRVRETRRKISRQSLTNAAAVRGEILEILRREIPPSSVRRMHILFPDPWPKRRHASRRLLQPEALATFAAALEPRGVLRFVTDDRPYFEQALHLMESAPAWQITDEDALTGWPQTEFQARFARLGLPAHGFIAIKK